MWDFLSDAQHDGIRDGRARRSDSRGAAKAASIRRPRCCATRPRATALPTTKYSAPCSPPMSFSDEDEALALANGTQYGLVAGIWTRDGARQMRLARRLRSGQVFINNYGAGGGVELPFGGVKHSGHGREKGFEALYGFTVLKTIAIRHG